MKYLINVLACVVLLGCTSGAKPIANLKFEGIRKSNLGYEILFQSDVNIESLYAGDGSKKIVAPWLICALENDRNFSIEHNLQRFYRGAIDLNGSISSSRRSYRYSSSGNFFLGFDNGGQTKILEPAELDGLLKSKESIECKVVLTIFLSKPYYSASMFIPVERIVGLFPSESR